MDDALLIERVAAEVWKRLQERQRRALALFTGGIIGAEEGLLALGKMKEHGWSFTAVMTPGAERALGTERVAGALPGVPILTEKNGWPPGPLLQEHNLLLVPVLTVNTAAKVAAGIADNLVTTLILEGLLMGKPVLAATDACDINHPTRVRLGMNRGMPALREQLAGNLERLAAYGVHLLAAKELAAAAEDLVQWPGRRREGQGQEVKVFTGKVLSRSHVAAWPGKEIIVARGTVITPLARDLAEEKGLRIRIQ